MITEEMFQEWEESPVTEFFKQYLKDSAEEEIELLADVLRNGGVLGDDEQLTSATTYAVLNRIAEIDLNEINGFYEEKEK